MHIDDYPLVEHFRTNPNPMYPEDTHGHAINIGFYKDADEVAALTDPDEIIEPAQTIEIRIDYPLNNPATIRKTHKGGFTRHALATAICEAYHEIYAEEDAGKTEQAENGPPMNRGQSNGKHGIWGHGIEDLVLEGAGRDAEGVWHVFTGS